jgi:SAM-dependent methyltransferase
MNVTRGEGLLENLLARQRAQMADSLIPDHFRTGRILDIGCGIRPYFLENISFAEKHGLNKDPVSVDIESSGYLQCRQCDVSASEGIPYEDNYFDVVTMLAVIEHFDSSSITRITAEVHRVLKDGGVFIATTPARWTDKLLRTLAALNLVSREEIMEHQVAYTSAMLKELYAKTGFSTDKYSSGYFEAYMNIWSLQAK